MKFLILISLFLSFSAYSFEVDKIDIENHPQSSFPTILVTIGNKTAPYYGMDSSQDEDLKFMKESSQVKGEIPLSGYIFAKEFVESFRLSNLVSNKKEKIEFVKIFEEKNVGKMVDFILSVDEKKRPAKTEKELKVILNLIKQKKSDELPEEVAIFSTGYIELKSPKGNNERYFIKVTDVNKETMTLNNNKTKINLLKSITIYSFQNILSGLNFGEIEKGSVEDQLFNKLESLNLSICGLNCPLTFTTDLSSLALNVGKIVNFEVVGNSKIENMDDFNKYVLAQQWCVLNNFSNACHVPELDSELLNMSKNKIISELITKHGSYEKMCKFLQK
ncbi:MAG: hypothetical protein PHY93_01365 [Bacteriovorax sp.]|nr:hypothetical protein [Bacteriovorax sp.]